MRSDHLTRHNKTHKDLLSLSDEEVKEELRRRHEIQIECEARRQKAREIALQEGFTIPEELTPNIEDIDLEGTR